MPSRFAETLLKSQHIAFANDLPFRCRIAMSLCQHEQTTPRSNLGRTYDEESIAENHA